MQQHDSDERGGQESHQVAASAAAAVTEAYAGCLYSLSPLWPAETNLHICQGTCWLCCWCCCRWCGCHVRCHAACQSHCSSAPGDGVLVLHQQVHCPAVQQQLVVLILKLTGCQAPLALLALELQQQATAAAALSSDTSCKWVLLLCAAGQARHGQDSHAC